MTAPTRTKTGEGGSSDIASATVRTISSDKFFNCGSSKCTDTSSWPISTPFATNRSENTPCKTGPGKKVGIMLTMHYKL